MPVMLPPNPTLATHIITVTNPVVSQDSDYNIAEDYTTPSRTSYIGIVQSTAGVEDDAGVIYSEGTFTAMIFSIADPGVMSQAEVTWAKISASPSVTARSLATRPLGPITLPVGWQPKCIAMAVSDEQERDTGRWLVNVKLKG